MVAEAFATRPFYFPNGGERWAELAARALPGDADAPATLLGWNPHLAVRGEALHSPGGLLPSDIVYLAPPAP